MGNKEIKKLQTINIYNDKWKMLRALPLFIIIFLVGLDVQQKSFVADVTPPIRILQLMGLSELKAIELIHYFVIFLILVWVYMFTLYLIELFNNKPIITISRKGISIRGAFINWNDVKSIYFYKYYKKEQIGLVISNDKKFLKQKGLQWRVIDSVFRIIFTHKLPLVNISLATTDYTKDEFIKKVITYSSRNNIMGKDRKY